MSNCVPMLAISVHPSVRFFVTYPSCHEFVTAADFSWWNFFKVAIGHAIRLVVAVVAIVASRFASASTVGWVTANEEITAATIVSKELNTMVSTGSSGFHLVGCWSLNWLDCLVNLCLFLQDSSRMQTVVEVRLIGKILSEIY